MPKSARYSERERLRLAVADALLNHRRLLRLAENPLAYDPLIGSLASREPYVNSPLGRELAVSHTIVACGQSLLSRIEGHELLRREATVLATVLAGQSISAAAASMHISREHLSNTAWRTVCTWIADEWQRRRTAL